MISLDTETTGVDFFHGAKPYLVTISQGEWDQIWYEWDVDPFTREPIIPKEDVEEITTILAVRSPYVLQNPRFDVRALETIGEHLGRYWPWSDTYDTLIAAHVLGSNERKDLTTLALKYLGVDLVPFEEAIKTATKEARNLVRRKDWVEVYGEWAIAKADRPDMPSAKEETWKFDMWLPRAVAKAEGYKSSHPWWTVLADYANSDSAVTLPIFKVQERILKEKDLWLIYKEQLKLLPIIYEMEGKGVGASRHRLKETEKDFGLRSEKLGDTCVSIAKGYNYDLTLPRSGNNKSLVSFCFDTLELPVVKRSEKTGNPSLDKTVIEEYMATLDNESPAYAFVESLRLKRKLDTSLSYLKSYNKFAIRKSKNDLIFHCSLNPTGTDTLRFSSSSPNSQQISKQEEANLRYVFGPPRGYEWWALDYDNLELTIPAYEAEEREIISLLERPNDPPYFGSFHLLVFDTLHPDKWNRDDPEGLLKAKKKFASTWYQWTKNGNFAVQYGAVEGSGTADAAYHVPGGQRRIKKRLGKIEQLNQKMIRHAEKFGYVETIPDKTVHLTNGYPLLCTRSNWGGITPTVPLSYHVQGTAMWCTRKAMIRCGDYLKKTDRGRMALQVHDEIVFELPEGSSRKIVNNLKKLMEKSGDDIGIPLRVSVSYHPNNWRDEE